MIAISVQTSNNREVHILTPEDQPLTAWARLEVQRMIDVTIERYDQRQDLRHKENSAKLDRLIWLIIVTLLSALGSLASNVLTHLWK